MLDSHQYYSSWFVLQLTSITEDYLNFDLKNLVFHTIAIFSKVKYIAIKVRNIVAPFLRLLSDHLVSHDSWTLFYCPEAWFYSGTFPFLRQAYLLFPPGIFWVIRLSWNFLSAARKFFRLRLKSLAWDCNYCWSSF